MFSLIIFRIVIIYQRVKSIFGLGLALAKAQFKLRNEGTWLGIFKDRLGADIPNYPLYLLPGIMLFNFFRKIADECLETLRKISEMQGLKVKLCPIGYAKGHNDIDFLRKIEDLSDGDFQGIYE